MSMIKYDVDGNVLWSSADGDITNIANPDHGGTGDSYDIKAYAEFDALIPASLGTFTLGGSPLTAIFAPAAVAQYNPVEPVLLGSATITDLLPAEAEFNPLVPSQVQNIYVPAAVVQHNPVEPKGVGYVFDPVGSIQFDALVPASIIGGATLTDVMPAGAEFDAIGEEDVLPYEVLDVTININLTDLATVQCDGLVPAFAMSITAPVAVAEFDGLSPHMSLNGGDMECTFPSMTCEIYGSSQISCTFPSLRFTADVNYRQIEIEIPLFTMTGNIYVGRIGDIEATMPSMTMTAYGGSEIVASLPSMTVSMDVNVDTVVIVSASLPKLTFSGEITDTTPADIDCTLPLIKCVIATHPGPVADITMSFPRFRCDIEASKPISGDILSRLPRLKCDMDVVPAEGNDLEASISMLTCVIKACEDDDEVWRHVIGLEYLEADMPMMRLYVEAS